MNEVNKYTQYLGLEARKEPRNPIWAWVLVAAAGAMLGVGLAFWL